MDVNEKGELVSVLDQHPDAERQYGRPVQELDFVSWAENKEGPFSLDLRVHCPMHTFSLMPTVLCVNCPWFGGVRQRIIHAGTTKDEKPKPLDFRDSAMAAKAFMVVCGHPQTRSLKYVPHVIV